MGKVDSSLGWFCKVTVKQLFIYFAAATNQNCRGRRSKTGASQLDAREYILLQNFILLSYEKLYL